MLDYLEQDVCTLTLVYQKITKSVIRGMPIKPCARRLETANSLLIFKSFATSCGILQY
jgi:hypothetical protein